jgi:hypothetical protein
MQEQNPFLTPAAGAPRREEPPGFSLWRWARKHPLLALLMAGMLAAHGYVYAYGMYLFVTDPS